MITSNRLVRSRSGFGAFSYGSAFGEATPGAVVNERVAAMVKVNDALYSALAAFKSSITSTNKEQINYEVENWHTNALKWMESAAAAAKDEKTFAGWKTWGINLAKSSDEILIKMGQSSWSSAAYNFVSSFPSSVNFVVKTASVAVVKTGGEILKAGAEGAGDAAAAAGWGIGKTLLFVGLPLALIVFIVTSGGRGFSLGPVRLGR